MPQSTQADLFSPLFHPAVAAWFDASFSGPTPCQSRAWASIAAGRHTLIAAPTGSGKTLAGFLMAIDGLVRQAAQGPLPEGTQVVYVSPLKALSNDIQRNLEGPLAGIGARIEAAGGEDPGIRTAVRTGDTPGTARALMRRRPPHILVTTPESLYILLTSGSGREMLATTRMVIVDEIHAVAGTKRGAHLALSLARLDALCATPPLRIGLSATQKPVEDIARFLVGPGRDCSIIDEGHVRDRVLSIEMPSSPLETVLSADTAREIYDRIAELIAAHRTTLVFVNTRRLAERVAKALSERLGEAAITAHHGSMARERRLEAEQRLKAGELKALVATASLELGIDIGEVDLVCQLGSTRTLAMFLQRVGRSGHAVGAVARGCLFPQTRDELVECAALLDMTRRGELDRIEIAGPALDVLAQQIVAEAASRDLALDELYALARRAWPYRDLGRARFDEVVAMLAEGFAFAQGRRSAYLHLDAVNGVVRARRGARLVAVTCGGAIPDTADYDVIAEPTGHVVGTVNEDFAVESLPGNIFQLGNTAWRVLKIEASAMRVEDAAGQPPDIPFWLGEAPARSAEMSQAVSRLREEFAARSDAAAPREAIEAWLADEIGAGAVAAAQLYDYLQGGYRALGAMPTQRRLVLERFFDESGGMQLVIHSPLGSRINRAWGLALRKRFCRQFNFELQAAAVEDAIVISLGAVHSFPLADVWRFLDAATVREVLTQALLDAPLFGVRWRWVAACALAIQRFRNGKKTPPRLIRMQAEDLVSLVFPDQLACFENLRGKREIPDHPLVNQAIEDCLQEALDVAGLEALLARIDAGEIELVARDQVEPSPFALAVLNANPYAFLDDAPLEERRTQAVQSRRWLDPETATNLGALDPQAIARVRAEVAPAPASIEELHDALLVAGLLAAQELDASAARWCEELIAAGRASEVRVTAGGPAIWVATERYRELVALWPDLERLRGEGLARWQDASPAPAREDALRALLRGRLDMSGPATPRELQRLLPVAAGELEAALLALEAEGAILRGRFSPGTEELEWCERRLLARIHRYTLNRLRAEIEPVTAADYLRFLLEWHYLAKDTQVDGVPATKRVLELLSGVEAPAASWEAALLPARVGDYLPSHLDQLLATGAATWARLPPREPPIGRHVGSLRATPLCVLPRAELALWTASADRSPPAPSASAQRVLDHLRAHGASFFEDLVGELGLLRTQLEQLLAELVALGHVTADSFVGLRALLLPAAKRRHAGGVRRRFGVTLEEAGRWSHVRRTTAAAVPSDAQLEALARVLLRRYGVVFRQVLARESRVPPWRDLLGALRRLEARGEVRGGRFVAGFSGEQFASTEALESLRRVRRGAESPQWVAVHAVDPCNLVGILVPGLRLPAVMGNRVVYLNGEAVAVQIGGETRFLRALPIDAQIRARTALAGLRDARGARTRLRRA
ncbi:MAG TPA: DEAD/DEAH box helicase [Gammaproteobacteria bacterium]|nr:DEAD/DEAH box helicase [Gammaproteobacteria bacterium]